MKCSDALDLFSDANSWVKIGGKRLWTDQIMGKCCCWTHPENLSKIETPLCRYILADFEHLPFFYPEWQSMKSLKRVFFGNLCFPEILVKDVKLMPERYWLSRVDICSCRCCDLSLLAPPPPTLFGSTNSFDLPVRTRHSRPFGNLNTSRYRRAEEVMPAPVCRSVDVKAAMPAHRYMAPGWGNTSWIHLWQPYCCYP